jgi:hypothetical protein
MEFHLYLLPAEPQDVGEPADRILEIAGGGPPQP